MGCYHPFDLSNFNVEHKIKSVRLIEVSARFKLKLDPIKSTLTNECRRTSDYVSSSKTPLNEYLIFKEKNSSSN